jgi:hypothetical protein
VLRSVETPILQRVVAESRQSPALGQMFWETGPGKLKQQVAAYLRELDRPRPCGFRTRTARQRTLSAW